MQVDMTIFQPIENFFTEVASDFNNYVILPAENFFVQANTVIVSGLYDLNMLVADIGNAVSFSGRVLSLINTNVHRLRRRLSTK
jgi:hypothetical protein